MCEVCNLMEEYEKHQKDLMFRISQFSHALMIDDKSEMQTAESRAINSLHAMLNTLQRMKVVADSKGADLRFEHEPEIRH